MNIKNTRFVNDGFYYRIDNETTYEVGQFKNSKLNGWGLKSYKSGESEFFVRGHFKDGLLDGIGIIYESKDESFDVVAGIFKEGNLVPLEEIKNSYPVHEIEWMSRTTRYEYPHMVTYYGDLTEDNYPKGLGVIYDGEKIYFGNWTEEGYRSGLFICPVGRDSFEDLHYPGDTGISATDWVYIMMANARIGNPYHRCKAFAKKERFRYGVIYEDEFKKEGYINGHKKLEGLGYALSGDKQEAGIYVNSQLYFGLTNYQPLKTKGVVSKDILVEDHYLILPKNFFKKHKKEKYGEFYYVGEKDNGIPHGIGILYEGDNLIVGEFDKGVNTGLSIYSEYNDKDNKYVLKNHYLAMEGKTSEETSLLDYFLRYFPEYIISNNE